MGLPGIGSQRTERRGSTSQSSAGVSRLPSGFGTRHRRTRPEPAATPTTTETVSLHAHAAHGPVRSGSSESSTWLLAPLYLIHFARAAGEHRFTDRRGHPLTGRSCQTGSASAAVAHP